MYLQLRHVVLDIIRSLLTKGGQSNVPNLAIVVGKLGCIDWA